MMKDAPATRELANEEAFYAPLAAQEAEAQAARLTLPYMAQLQRMHAGWMASFDHAETDTATVPELLELLKTAPTEFARGLVFGKLAIRAQELSAARLVS